MWLSAPMTVGPLMTTWGPTIVPAPICTSGPMMENGPTVTSAASWAFGEMIARASITCRLRGHHHFGMRDFDFPDEGRGLELPDTPERALYGGFQDELVAWDDRLTEARLVDADKVEAGLLRGNDVRAREREDAGGLRQGFDDHDAGHHGAPGKWPGKNGSL